MDFLGQGNLFSTPNQQNLPQVYQEESSGQLGFKSQRKILRVLKPTGKRKKFERSQVKHALPPGKRVSKTGKVYWETRKNRSYLPEGYRQ